MTNRLRFHLIGCPMLILLLGGPAVNLPLSSGTARADGPLLVDSDFEQNESGKQLRARETPQGWYESRRDESEGRLLLKLSTKPIGDNPTRKAMIKASAEFNTYLSQRLAEPQKAEFTLQWDVYVREIAPAHNRSAFQMIGNAAVRGRGPNGSGKERFVFLAFENAPQPGKINLFAFEGRDPDYWDARTTLVRGLELKRWYTIVVELDIPGKSYRVSIPGVTAEPREVRSYHYRGETPDVLTHVSFASWNDGPGTFYIDNVREP